MKRRIAVTFVALALALGPAAVGRVLAGVTGVANDDSYPVGGQTLFEDDQLVVNAANGVLANDGPAGPPTRCVTDYDTTGLQGDLTLNTDGSFQFDPADNFNGSTFFTYQMGTAFGSSCPEGGESNEATVTFTYAKVNDPPFISTDQCAVDIEVEEDSGPFTAPRCVQMQDFGPSDENNQNFSEWVFSSTKPALFSVQPTITQGVGLYGALDFTPAANATGTATVTVRGRDTGGTADGGDDLSTKLEFDIRITGTNDPPTANADSFTAIPDRTLNVKKPGVLKNDSDIDGDDLTAEKVSSPSHGIVNLAADGAFSYTPDAGYVGPDAFSYRASDGDEVSATKVVTLNVTSVPTAPPTVAPPTAAPTTAEPSVEPSPSASAEPSGSLEPSASPSLAPSPSASLEPGATPAPEPAESSGGLSLPVLIVALLLIALLAFGAAIFVPKWIESRRVGGGSGGSGGGYGGSGTG